MTVMAGMRARASAPIRDERSPHAGDALASLASDGATRIVTLSLVGAATVELAILRVGLRSAVHIPGLTPLGGAAGAAAEVGRFAFSLATVLLVLLLLVLAVRAARRAALLDVVAATGVSSMLLGVALAAAGTAGDLTVGLFSLTALALILPRAALAVGRRGVVTLVTMTAGFMLASMVVILPLAGSGVPSALLPLGEGFALVGAIASPLLLGRVRPHRRARALAPLAGAGTLALLLGDAAVAKNLALWTFGLAGYFPPLVYAAAATSLAYTVLAAVRAGRAPLAASVVLLTVGGIGLHNTYQTALVIAGLALIGERWTRVAQPTRAEAVAPPFPTGILDNAPGDMRFGQSDHDRAVLRRAGQ